MLDKAACEDVGYLELRLLTLLDSHYNMQVGSAWPSQETLARLLFGADRGPAMRKHVTVALGRLQAQGFIAIGTWDGRKRYYRLLRQEKPGAVEQVRYTGPIEEEQVRPAGPIGAVDPEQVRPTGPEQVRPTGPRTLKGNRKETVSTPASSSQTAAAALDEPIGIDWRPSAEDVAEARAKYPKHQLGDGELDAVNQEFLAYCQRRKTPYSAVRRAWFSNLGRYVTRLESGATPYTAARAARPDNRGPSQRTPAGQLGPIEQVPRDRTQTT